MNRMKQKQKSRKRRHLRVRRKIIGTPARPRLSVYRSLKNIYCQIINDVRHETIVSTSTLSKELKNSIKYGGNIEASEIVGSAIAQKAKERGIKKVKFDKGPYKYHGRIKALAESARKEGLKF